MTICLSTTGLSKRYGGTWVLRDVAMTLRRGQVLALLGENGAGKSTLVKILSGAVAADQGEVRIDDRPIASGRPVASRRAGLAMVYQELSVCDDLSIEDNVMLGREPTRGGLLDPAATRRATLEVLKRLGHTELDPSRLVQSLSVGGKQLVEIARALAGNAKVLILDEPTSSLPVADVEQLFAVVRKLAADGLAVIYISHFLEEVRSLCDSYLVLRDGAVAGSGSLAGTSQAEIVRLMVGRTVDELYPRSEHTVGPPLLEVHGVSGVRSPADVSLTVRRGEIHGLAGLIGAGRTELARCLYGLDPVTAGTVTMDQQPIKVRSTADAIDAGIAMVSEDRKAEGLALSLSIQDNVTLGRLNRYSRAGWLRLGKRWAAVVAWMDRLRVKADSPDVIVATLSGGNQQKVAIARVLHQDAKLLILDEPTRGVDVGTKSEIYRLMNQSAAAGTTVLFISSYFQELLNMCDTISVMSRGRLVQTKPAADWTEHELLLAAMGSGTASTDVPTV